MTMPSDREWIAEFLWDRAGKLVGLSGMAEWSDIHDRYRDEWRGIADDLLAALAGRLLPPLPEWVQEVTVTLLGGLGVDDLGWESYHRIVVGTGHDFTAAISALEGANDD